MSGSRQFTDEKDFPKLSEPSGKPILTGRSRREVSGAEDPIHFFELPDTPADYEGFAGYAVIVRISEDGLTFTPFTHDNIGDSHNLTDDIDHNLLDNYNPNEHINWAVTGPELIHIDRIDMPSISHADDDFYNSLDEVVTIEGEDQVLIADSSDGFAYKRISRENFVSGLSTVLNAYFRITADSGIANLDADGASQIYISGDGELLQSVGSSPGSNRLDFALLDQSANRILAGPVTGSDDTPTFRGLIDDDMPESYNYVNWDAAYEHSEIDSGNPHNVSFTDLGSVHHHDMGGLLDDDHTQYALLSGRAGDVLHIDQIDEFTADGGIEVVAPITVNTTAAQSRFYTGLMVNEAGGSDSIYDFQVNSASYNALLVDASDDSIRVMNDTFGKLSFFGVTPTVRSTGWTITNTDTGHSYDVVATTVNELAIVLGNLIEELKTKGLLSG